MQEPLYERRFLNPAFASDTGVADEYEDINDQEYAYVKESHWEVQWEDLDLTGQILGKGSFGDVQLGRVRIKGKWLQAAVKTLKGNFASKSYQ